MVSFPTRNRCSNFTIWRWSGLPRSGPVRCSTGLQRSTALSLSWVTGCRDQGEPNESRTQSWSFDRRGRELGLAARPLLILSSCPHQTTKPKPKPKAIYTDIFTKPSERIVPVLKRHVHVPKGSSLHPKDQDDFPEGVIPFSRTGSWFSETRRSVSETRRSISESRRSIPRNRQITFRNHH